MSKCFKMNTRNKRKWCLKFIGPDSLRISYAESMERTFLKNDLLRYNDLERHSWGKNELNPK